MRDLVINNRTQRVFVISESDTRIVYIPVKACDRIDYEELKKIEANTVAGSDMLRTMKKHRLPNNRNALVQYQNIFQVMTKSGEREGTRLKRPDEPESALVDKNQVPTKVEAPRENAGGLPFSDVTDPKELIQLGVEPEYTYTDKSGKKKIWGGKGRVPDVIKEAVDGGADLSDFRTA